MASSRRLTRYALAVLFVMAGALHFLAPALYVQIMPPYLPWPRGLVYVSGAAEVAGGLGLLLARPVRRWAGYGLLLLLGAVFPANVHMAHEAVQASGAGMLYTLAVLARLPLQFVLGAVVWWAAVSPGEAPRRREGRR